MSIIQYLQSHPNWNITVLSILGCLAFVLGRYAAPSTKEALRNTRLKRILDRVEVEAYHRGYYADDADTPAARYPSFYSKPICSECGREDPFHSAACSLCPVLPEPLPAWHEQPSYWRDIDRETDMPRPGQDALGATNPRITGPGQPIDQDDLYREPDEDWVQTAITHMEGEWDPDPTSDIGRWGRVPEHRVQEYRRNATTVCDRTGECNLDQNCPTYGNCMDFHLPGESDWLQRNLARHEQVMSQIRKDTSDWAAQASLRIDIMAERIYRAELTAGQPVAV